MKFEEKKRNIFEKNDEWKWGSFLGHFFVIFFCKLRLNYIFNQEIMNGGIHLGLIIGGRVASHFAKDLKGFTRLSHGYCKKV